MRMTKKIAFGTATLLLLIIAAAVLRSPSNNKQPVPVSGNTAKNVKSAQEARRPNEVAGAANNKPISPPRSGGLGSNQHSFLKQTRRNRPFATPSFPPHSKLIGERLEDQERKLSSFRSSDIHSQWLGRVEALVGDRLSEDDRSEIRQRHLRFLQAHDEITSQYLLEQITQQQFAEHLQTLLRWHQDFFKELLDDAGYTALFEVSKDETDVTVQAIATPPTEIEVLNPAAGVEETVQKVSEDKLQKLMTLRKQCLLQVRDVDDAFREANLSEQQALAAANNAFKEYTEQARLLLSDDEFKLIFGEMSMN